MKKGAIKIKSKIDAQTAKTKNLEKRTKQKYTKKDKENAKKGG